MDGGIRGRGTDGRARRRRKAAASPLTVHFRPQNFQFPTKGDGENFTTITAGRSARFERIKVTRTVKGAGGGRGTYGTRSNERTNAREGGSEWESNFDLPLFPKSKFNETDVTRRPG